MYCTLGKFLDDPGPNLKIARSHTPIRFGECITLYRWWSECDRAILTPHLLRGAPLTSSIAHSLPRSIAHSLGQSLTHSLVLAPSALAPSTLAPSLPRLRAAANNDEQRRAMTTTIDDKQQPNNEKHQRAPTSKQQRATTNDTQRGRHGGGICVSNWILEA